jgi:hypothetical protein
LTAEIGFIHFDSAGKDLRYVFGQRYPYNRKGSQDSFSFYSGSKGYVQTALFNEEPSDNFFPLIPRKIERKTMGREFVLAPGTLPFPI